MELITAEKSFMIQAPGLRLIDPVFKTDSQWVP
jgi:hypothetical protein